MNGPPFLKLTMSKASARVFMFLHASAISSRLAIGPLQMAVVMDAVMRAAEL